MHNAVAMRDGKGRHATGNGEAPTDPQEAANAPPHSTEAEQGVLGGMLLDNSAWPHAAELLTAQDFYRFEHRLIFSAIGQLIAAGQPADVLTVAAQLQALGKAEEAGGTAYLNALAGSVPSAANVRHYAQMVRECAVLRGFITAAAHIRDAACAKGADPASVRARAQEVIADAAGAFAPDEPMVFMLRPAAQLISDPAMAWCVKGLLPARGIAALFGPPMSGKSFLALDLATAIAEGRTWFGRRVRARRVVYLALEGAAGLGQRLRAWERHHERPVPDGIVFITEPVKLVEDVVKLIATLAQLGDEIVIVIDTLNAATPGADENASRDMGLVIDAAKTLAEATNGLVLLVAHTGKDEARGMRGHSSQFAALDGAIQTTNEAGRRTWEAAKVKDAEAGAVHRFRLRRVDLGTDAEGDPISSCVVEPDDSQLDEATAPRVQPRGSNQKIVVKTLAPLFRASRAYGKGGAPAMRPCLEMEAAVSACASRMACDPKHRMQYARSALSALVANGLFGCGDGWVWLA